MNVQAEIEAGTAYVKGLPGMVEFTMIGSAAYMPEQEVGDVDFLVLVEGNNAVDYANGLLQQGWQSCGEYDSEAGTWDAVRRENLNLVVTTDREFYERFKRAMEVCKALRLKHKEHRVAVCRIVRDGWLADAALPYLGEGAIA